MDYSPAAVHRTPKAGREARAPGSVRFEWPVKHSGHIACKRQHDLLSRVSSAGLGGQSGIWIIVPQLFIEPPKRAGRPALRAPSALNGLLNIAGVQPVIVIMVFRAEAGVRSAGLPARLEWPVKHSGLIACNRQHGLLSRVGSAGLGGQSGIWVIVPLLVHRTPKAGREARAPGSVRFEWPVKHSGHIACNRHHGLPCGGRSPERGPPGPLRMAC